MKGRSRATMEHLESAHITSVARDNALSADQLRDAVIAELFPFIRYLESLRWKESQHGYRYGRTAALQAHGLAKQLKTILVGGDVEHQIDHIASLRVARSDIGFQRHLTMMRKPTITRCK